VLNTTSIEKIVLLDFKVHCNNYLFQKAENEFFNLPANCEAAGKMTFSQWRDKYSVNVFRFEFESLFTDKNYIVESKEEARSESPQITTKSDVPQKKIRK
jgi:hypothetical protein